MQPQNRVKCTVFIQYGLNQKLKRLSSKNQISKTKFITDILEEVVRRIESKKKIR